jgi:hypothetical protein
MRDQGSDPAKIGPDSAKEDGAVRRWQIPDFKRFLSEGPDLDALRITRARELARVVELRSPSQT